MSNVSTIHRCRKNGTVFGGGATHSWRQRKRSTANTTKEEMRTDISMAVDDIAYEMASQYIPEPCVENDGREYVAFLFPALRALALV